MSRMTRLNAGFQIRKNIIQNEEASSRRGDGTILFYKTPVG
jgi:hypothetical protein